MFAIFNSGDHDTIEDGVQRLIRDRNVNAVDDNRYTTLHWVSLKGNSL